jgi:tyrosyl-tRNA synthetase
MSISDDMMENYFTLLTNIRPDEIAELTDPAKTHPKEAKVLLAKTIVTQFHDEEAAMCAAAEFEKVFAKGQLPDDMPEVVIEADAIIASKLLVTCGLVASGGEAKRMIKQSAVSVDGERVNNPNAEITPINGMVVQVGKRKFARLKVK